MILTREIIIKINESNLPYYENLGYEVSIGDEINIPIEILSKGSHYKIVCKCDKCGVEKEVIYKNYLIKKLMRLKTQNSFSFRWFLLLNESK